MKIEIRVKSNTGGFYDSDDCDLLLAEVEADVVPRIGETVQICVNDMDNRKIRKECLVTGVQHLIDEDYYGVSVYVVPIGWEL